MVDHQFYIDWGKEKLENAILHLKESYQESNNALLGAIIHNLEDQLKLLSGDHQLY